MPTSGNSLPLSPVLTVPASPATPASSQVTVQIQIPNAPTNTPVAPTPPAPPSPQNSFARFTQSRPITPPAPATTGVTISVQGGQNTTPATVVNTPAPTPSVATDPALATQPAHTLRRSKISVFLQWGIVTALTAQGLKGFFDSLYFITVEFQNFEKGITEHLVESSLANQLVIKASLLIFATALSFFFSLQLTVFQEKGPGKLKMLMSVVVGISCFFVLHYANMINVVDLFK